MLKAFLPPFFRKRVSFHQLVITGNQTHARKYNIHVKVVSAGCLVESCQLAHMLCIEMELWVGVVYAKSPWTFDRDASFGNVRIKEYCTTMKVNGYNRLLACEKSRSKNSISPGTFQNAVSIFLER